MAYNGVNGYIFFRSKSQRIFSALIAVVCLSVLTVKEAGGQEALRLSTEGDLYAAYRQQANTDIGYYNLLLGPTAWKFDSGLGLSYNDNVNYSPNPEGDFIIRPNVDTQMHWPISFRNSLDISLGAGYSEYVVHSDLSQFFITPGSGFSFDVYLGNDFKINLHDRISISEDAYQNAGSSGSGQNLVSLENVAGTYAQWTLFKAVANFGYDHANYATLSQNQSQPGTASENFFANAGINVRPEMVLGVEAGTSLITYDQSGVNNNSFVTPNAVQWNAGVFNSTKISDYMSVRLDVGYTIYTPDNTAINLVTSDNSGPYFTASLSHRVNQWVSYTLSAGRSTDLSSYGQVQSRYFVGISPTWNFLNKYTISTPFQWQQGTEVYNYNYALNSNANYDQITLGASVSRTLTRKLTGQVSYQYVKETSDVATISYTANIVALNLTYNF